jgi:hypothetical protein
MEQLPSFVADLHSVLDSDSVTSAPSAEPVEGTETE